MVIDGRASRTIFIFESSQSELLIAGPPYPDLVVVQIDGGTDAPIGLAFGHEQDHSCPLGRSSLDGVGPHACLEFSTVTSTQFEGRKSHPPMKSHHCYYREDPLVFLLPPTNGSHELHVNLDLMTGRVGSAPRLADSQPCAHWLVGRECGMPKAPPKQFRPDVEAGTRRRGGRLKIAVLVKQVPRVEDMTLGEGGRLRREGIELEMNAYCRRAVSKGVELAHLTAGRCVVFTLGPPSAEDVLREAVAWGADEGVLVRTPPSPGPTPSRPPGPLQQRSKRAAPGT